MPESLRPSSIPPPAGEDAPRSVRLELATVVPKHDAPPEPPRTRAQTFAAFGHLARLLGEEWPAYAAGTVFICVAMTMALLIPQVIKYVIDDVLHDGHIERLGRVTAVLCGVLVVDAIAMALRARLFQQAGESILARLRRRLFRNIIEQEIAFFDRMRTADLTSRLSADMAVLQDALGNELADVVRHIAFIAVGGTLLAMTSTHLAAVVAVAIPIVAAVVSIVSRRLKGLARRSQDALATANTIAEESVSGMRTLRYLAQEKHAAGRYERAVGVALSAARARISASSSTEGLVSLLGESIVPLIIWLGARAVANGELTTGSLITFLLYASYVAGALRDLFACFSRYIRYAGAAERIFEVLERKPVVAPGKRKLDRVAGRIRLEDVVFQYPTRPDVNVLDGVDITIEPGTMIALVGHSGSGKSTVASLITRLYEADRGRLTLDGIDLRDLEVSWLRDQIGVVEQEPTLFATTIRENIQYGRMNATPAEIVEAARIANAHTFIAGLPDGYDTVIGERGLQLSVGQKQRVAIARAVLRDPRILILDEATSALDAGSEVLVQEALERVMASRTTLVIAHRLSTVVNADCIFVLAHGRVAQAGRHEQLLAEPGIYRQLVHSQLVQDTGSRPSFPEHVAQ